MKRTNARQATRLWICAGLLALLLTTPAFGNDKIVKIENFGSGLYFTPLVEFERLILTVTGPCGFDFRQVSTSGELLFKLDETTIDGAYSFNIVRQEKVDEGVVEVLKEARLNFDDETPKQLCRDGKLPATPLVQASGFLVDKGKIIFDPEAVEDPRGYADSQQGGQQDIGGGSNPLDIPLKDFVINDDLIVDGSACIGFDCVNGESFSFDTIRLKENNLRIKFDDTSVAASFPRTDWQLTANASANGGASKFSIDDISGSRTPFTVEANARSHSLYVDDGGRIGNRTSTPSTEIHTIDGDTPTLRLQQDGSSGFAPQTWDVAGNETNFFIRDVSNGSTLPFRIRPGAPTSSIFIDVSGDVGLGTASPGATLHLLEGGTSFSAFAGTGFMVQSNSSTGDGVIGSFLAGTSGSAQFSFGDVDNQFVGRILYDNNTDVMRIDAGGSPQISISDDATDTITHQHSAAVLSRAGVWQDASSRALKENIHALSTQAALEAFAQLEPVTYNYKAEPDELSVGFISEEVPELVATASRSTLASLDLIALLTKVVQEQQKLVDDQQQTIEGLASRLSQLESGQR